MIHFDLVSLPCGWYIIEDSCSGSNENSDMHKYSDEIMAHNFPPFVMASDMKLGCLLCW